MQLPNGLTFVRHGLSLANVAMTRALRNGDESLYTPEFRAMHTSEVPLVQEGIAQARRTGEWLKRRRKGHPFDRHYMSTYRRGQETAFYLDLPRAAWHLECALRERDWGEIDHLPPSEKKRRWPHYEEQLRNSPYHFVPYSGQSFADTFTRLFVFLEYIGRVYTDCDVICVAHYEIIQCCRIIIEHLSEAEFREREQELGLGNCDALMYSVSRSGYMECEVYRNKTDIVSPRTLIKRRGITNEELGRELGIL